MATTETPTLPAPRPMVPREHGAWGQLALPLVCGLLLGRPSASAALLALAVVAVFVAHEPLLILLGQRGRRPREEQGSRAWRWLAASCGIALGSGAAGLALAPPPARAALAVPTALGAAVAVLVWRRLEKTAAGEMLVAAALASAGGAVAVAGGAPLANALAATLAWVLSFAAATLGVRAVLARLRSRGDEDHRARNAALAALVGAAAFGLSAAGLPAALGWATLPGAIAGVGIALAPLGGRHLRAVGWSIVAVSASTLGILLAGLRG